MKKDRKRLTVLTFFLFLAGLGYAAFTLLPPLFPRRGIIPFKADDIMKITVKGKSRTQTIVREGAGYSVEDKGAWFRGDGEKIDRLIASFGKISKTTIVSGNRENQGAFGIGPESITIQAKNGKITLYVGSPEGQNETYARLNGEALVFTADALGTAPAQEDYRDLKPRTIPGPASVESLAIERDGTTLVLARKSDGWYAGSRKANANAVSYYLDDLASLPAKDVFASPPPGLPASPLLTVRWKGAKGEGEARFFDRDENTTILVLSGSGYSYLVPRVYAASLLKGENDFLGG